MVLGLRSKNKRPLSIQVDYTIHIQEIRPWPPSQSLKSLKSVALQWENGGRTSGLTRNVSPSQSKIEFNEKFNLHVTLVKDGSKGNGFQKNVLELSLFEARRDKALKGQLLGNAVVDLGEHGVVNDAESFGVPLNCKRSYRSTAQPVVYIKIRPVDKESSSVSASSSFRDDSLSKEGALDKDGRESVSALMSEEYAEEEIASFTDDDVSSHSSHGNVASAPDANVELADQSCREQEMQRENEPDTKDENEVVPDLPLKCMLMKPELEPTTTVSVNNSLPKSFEEELSINTESLVNGDTPFSTSPAGKSDASTTHSSASSPTSEAKENVDDKPQKNAAIDNQNEIVKPVTTPKPQRSTDDKRSLEITSINDAQEIFVEENIKENQIENGADENIEVIQNKSIEIESVPNNSPDNSAVVSCKIPEITTTVPHKYLQNSLRKPANSELTTPSPIFIDELGSRSRTLTGDRVKNMGFTMRSPSHSQEDVKEIDILEDKVKHSPKNNNINIPNNKVKVLEARVEKLEGELKEAAAVEISVYSIVAEHGSSMHKVHTPARRLSRLYIHALKDLSRERKVNAAKSAVSGLVLAAKACGNDVPRLTFWLSNSIVLRAIITRAAGHSDKSHKFSAHSASNGSRSMAKGKSPPLKWESLRQKKETFTFSNKEFDDWEDLSTFTDALERIESWIFSRTIESIWWQTLTPHMQSTKKNIGRKLSFSDKKFDNFSIEIWKKAFSHACERLCPVRAEGHECGCLPLLARLVMEQCVARLDVAMFNAILRESDDEIPTDPVSDPISDPKVLPIPPGKLSFGAGAELKNAIGNWSRWLTDLFGMDMDESPQEKNEHDDERVDVVETVQSFCRLNALSDLLMLPKDMLLEKSIRKEVCPTFSASMIKRILDRFLPDEFCPDVIPSEVLEALDFEDSLETNEEEIQPYPCNASPVSYSAPSVASIEKIIGDVRSLPVLKRSGSSVLRKCHTSDDELNELDSPLASIMMENSSTPIARSKGDNNATVHRYQLLRNVWKNVD